MTVSDVCGSVRILSSFPFFFSFSLPIQRSSRFFPLRLSDLSASYVTVDLTFFHAPPVHTTSLWWSALTTVIPCEFRVDGSSRFRASPEMLNSKLRTASITNSSAQALRIYTQHHSYQR